MELLRSAYQLLEMAVGWVFSASWLPPHDFRLMQWMFKPGFGYGFILVGFLVGELFVPAQRRPWGRATLLSTAYLFLAGKMGFYSMIVAPAIRQAWLALDLPSAHLDRLLPLPVYMIVSVLTVTFVAYWSHRLMHRTPLLWQIHKIHHSATNLNAATVYHKHFLETLLQAPSHLFVVLSLGTDLVAPFGIIFKFIDILGHSNVDLDLGRLACVASTPQAHRIHHSIERRHFDSNFGNTLMIWDWVFGTLNYDRLNPAERFGVDETIPTSFVKQQFLPFVWMWQTLRDRWRGAQTSRCGSREAS